MNALRTVFSASRALRISLFLCLLALLAGLTPPGVSAQTGQGGLGQALALMGSLHASQVRAATPAAAENFNGLQRTPNGRVLLGRNMMRPGALRANATSSSTVPIPGADQTFDVNNPAPAFQPLIGYQNPDGSLGNNPANAPIFQPLNALIPTNLTPIWSADEKFLIFSSNRALRGDVNREGIDGITSRFHLWAISVNGGEAFQITTSQATMGENTAIPHGEFFPTLTPNDGSLAFTSDAQSSGTQNLFVLSNFSVSALLTLNNTQAFQNVSNIDTTNGGILSVTLRAPAGQTTFPTEAQSAALTGFGQVQRPTFLGTNAGELVFSAQSVTGPNAGRSHLYFLYTSSGGSDPNNISFPGQLTDGPADDTDPASSKDGQFVAFASTATALTANGAGGAVPSLTSGGVVGGNRTIFLVGGGGTSGNGLGVVPTSLRSQAVNGRVGAITAAGADNFGPAWSFNNPNQFTNPSPGFEYLAFARGASPTSTHDIYYIQAVRFVNAGGVSQRSVEAATTPLTFNAPVYQINAGDLNLNDQFGSYLPDNSRLFNGGLGFFTGGTAETIAPAQNISTASDPGTPPGIFLTDRNGTFSYTLPNLTAGATYTVRLHFSDPASTAAGQRVFNVAANGNPALTNFDITAAALAGDGNFGGIVSVGGAPQIGATVTVTNGAGNVVGSLTTGQPQTIAPPNGDGNPTNYFSNLPAGTYTVTTTAPGFTAQSQTIVVNSSGFTRADFNLVSAATVTATGTVTAGGGPALNIPIRITDPVTNVVIASGTTNGTNGQFSFPTPVGTFNVTANPATASGFATQTQQFTFTSGGPNVVNFTLAAGAGAVGTLGGLVTDAGSGQSLAGVTVTVRAAGAVVAIVTTGSGQPQNYSLNLPGAATPGIQYNVTFSLPGYTSGQATPSVINGALTSQNQALAHANGARPNSAVVRAFPVTVPTNSNSITLNFTPTNPAKGVPIVEGIEVLAGARFNGNQTASSGFGSLTTAVDPSAPQNLLAIGDFAGGQNGNGLVTLTFNPPGGTGGNLGTPASYTVFRSNGFGTFINQPGNGSGQEGAFPYLLNVTPTTTFVNGNFLETILDQNAAIGDEYYYQVVANFLEQIVPEGATPTGASAPNAVVLLNTDDNRGETTGSRTAVGGQQETAQTGNTFDDVYPAWSPGLSIFSITYQGGGFNFATGVVTNSRTVTYNDPATSFPSETAISVTPGGIVNTSNPAQPSYTVVGLTPTAGTLGYTGIFESQVLNLDPPTLLRYNPNEIIHVQAGSSATPISGVSEKVGIAPGQKVTITVRLSDREAGIDNGTNTDGTARAPINGGPTGNVNVGAGTVASRSQVFLQIKNPNSKYQDSQNLEHKVFAKDSAYNNQPNRATRNDLDSGTANATLGLGFNGYEGLFNIDGSNNLPINKYLYPPMGTPDQTAPVIGQHVFPRGAHGGQWTFPDPNNPDDTYMFVGKSGGGNDPAGAGTGDPALFIPTGPEYECQLINPLFATSGNPNSPADVSPADFRNPFYLAGVDDQQAFSGSGTTRPVTQNGVNPAEWLQMAISPVQDNRGGVLYTVTWTTPASATDFFLDVVAYDQAVFPGIPGGTSHYVNNKVNWRIYDNVGGFSTVQNLSSANSILVVSDYALGQKFAATTFAGRDSNLNLVPKLFGAESYVTDVDVSTLPDSLYGGTFVGSMVYPYSAPYLLVPGLFPWTVYGSFFGTTITTQNGLGVGSYYDTIIDDGERRDGAPDLPTQRYTIWRTLARGPVTDSVLAGYLPLKESQPAINDPIDAAFANIPAATILNAPRCVIWLSPYTGDLLTDPGSLNDPGTPAQNGSVARPSTQTVLRNFVLGDGTAAHPGGGRLFMTGQDIGATLTINGTSGNTAGGFLPDVLSAKEGTPGGGTRVLAATANRITGSPFYDNTRDGRYLTITGNYTTGFFIFNLLNYPYQDNLILGGPDRDDAALDQIPATTLSTGASIQGRIDTITPTNGATIAATYGAGGPAAMVYHDDPFSGNTQTGQPNSGTGSRTVYAAFGIEAMSSDYYASIAPLLPGNPLPPPTPPPAIPRDPRQAILHNIVCYLRTASVTGIITQTAGPTVAAGTPVSGVTVYLRPTGGAPPTRAAFSASSGGDGRFTIDGIEPGTYTLVAYKSGFQRTVGNNGTAFTLEGGVVRNNGTLTLTALNPGSIAGNVKDTTGNALIGATVTFTSTDKTTTTSTTTRTGLQAGQPAGSYFVDNVPVATYTAVADGPRNDQGTLEYTTATAPDAPFAAGAPVLSNATTQPVNFTLTPILAKISGRVTSSGGTPLAGATVNLLDSTGKPVLDAAGKPITTTTAADGTYTFTNVPAASTALSPTPTGGTPYTITVTDAGYGTGTAPGPIMVELGDVITDTTAPAHSTDVVLTPLASISGRIFDSSVGDTDAGGVNVAGATVTLTNAAGTVVATTSAAGARTVATDPAPGSYTFANVPSATAATTYTVTATRVGFTTNSSASFTVVLGSVITGKDIGLAPIRPGSITGKVTDATGAGVAGALVTFVSADTTATLHATADGNGNYSLPTVFPGTYKGTATGPLNPNGRPTTTQGTVSVTVASAPAVTTGNFSVVTIPPSLAGTVTDSVTKAPLKNVLVTITNTASGTVVQTLHTDAAGNYSTGPLPASGLPLSQYTVTITASLVGYATQSLLSQSIYNGDALTGQNVALVSAKPGSVSGQVTDVSNGTGVSGAVVSFLSTDGTTTLGPATTDANGNYSIPTTGKTDPSGNYIASVTPPNNANGKPEFSPAATQNVTIPANGTQTVNFVLTEILAAVSGKVLDNQAGTPISGATVTLTDSTGRAVGTPQTTGADGTYSFANIPASQTPAAFALSATAAGAYFPGALTVTLTLGDSLTGQNIGLDEKGTITGLVTDGSTGQPLPNVALTVTDTTTKATPTNLTPTPLVTTPGTAVGPDGKTSNYIATFTLTPGHSYSVSASKPNYNPAAPVVVTPSPLTAGQAGRADLQLTSGIGTLGGLVGDGTTNTPVGGATVTVTSVTATGVSTVVATFTTNSSVSPAPDGKAQGINYTGQVAQGSYTVTLTFGSRTPVVQKVTVVGGQFNRLDFTGANGTPPVYTFPAGLQFLSTPYDYSSLSFDTLFGVLNTAPTGTPPNGNRTHVAVWDPTVSQYAVDPNAPADSLRLGVGYWVFLKNPVPLTVQGAAPSAAFVPVALHPSWNQIGVPNISGVPVSSLMFDNGAGGMISFATAVSSQYHVVAPTLYSYDGSSYQTVTQSSVLQPWKAYWIQVYSGATLEIPTK